MPTNLRGQPTVGRGRAINSVATDITRVSFAASDVVSEWRIDRVHAVRGSPSRAASTTPEIWGRLSIF
jgi:hypothetical protein